MQTYRPPRHLLIVAALALLVGGMSLVREVTRQNDGSDLKVAEDLPPAVRADLLDAAQTAYGLFDTPQFAQALAAGAGGQPIYISRDRRAGSVAEVLERLRSEGRFLPVRLVLMTQGEANAAWHYAAGGGVGYFTQDGEIHLPPEVAAQWRAEDPVVRSCALNTLAHEIAHTVSVSPFVFTPAFTDTSLDAPTIPGRRPGESPIGSYLIGSAAQCAWLARQGRIEDAELGACVEVFGAAGFNDRCAAFGGGEPVRERAGLPPPMPGL
ncbi:MAG: hypothetical protein H2041_01505 [Phenylobacterium sp.]|uniref:hypothetical protein n=1 Tax=Phenylobacterium sp. TaxID=1871053 RepID=UPI0017B04132|nr:hypothetical protein [Phenylobacterium sp.]MBA4792322.1 hypothetical protein [Phenylobacterium sp.]